MFHSHIMNTASIYACCLHDSLCHQVPDSPPDFKHDSHPDPNPVSHPDPHPNIDPHRG